MLINWIYAKINQLLRVLVRKAASNSSPSIDDQADFLSTCDPGKKLYVKAYGSTLLRWSRSYT